MKRFYAISAMALLALGATAVAQSYHGFYRPFTEAFVKNCKNGIENENGWEAYDLNEYWDPAHIINDAAKSKTSKIFWLETAYHPNYQFPKSADEPGTWIEGTADVSPTQDKLQPKLESGAQDGFILEKSYKNLMAWVTVPDQYYKGGTLTAVPDKGTVRFRIAAHGDPNRMGDQDNFYATDMNGFYLTVCAPAGVTIDCGVVSANGTTNMGDGNGKCFRAPHFTVGTVTQDNKIADITATKNNQTWDGGVALFTYKRSGKDEYGFPTKYFDIVFRGVKAGDVIGLGNYQTLHDGYTPVSAEAAGIDMTVTGAVSEIVADENAPVEYYNLQGVRVANPENGLYIVRQGSKTSKVLVK